MGSQAPTIRANVRTLGKRPSRKPATGGSRLRDERPRGRHQAFAAFGTPTSGLIAKATTHVEAVTGTTLRNISRRQYAKLIAQLAALSYLMGFALDWNVNFHLVSVGFQQCRFGFPKLWRRSASVSLSLFSSRTHASSRMGYRCYVCPSCFGGAEIARVAQEA
jgi:hypothetical protein